jgi:hypothetical protein
MHHYNLWGQFVNSFKLGLYRESSCQSNRVWIVSRQSTFLSVGETLKPFLPLLGVVHSFLLLLYSPMSAIEPGWVPGQGWR